MARPHPQQITVSADQRAVLERLLRLHSSLGYLPPVEYESLYNAIEKHS